MPARRTLASALIATATVLAAVTVLPGCAVTRGQSTVGAYIDDAAITTAVKAKFVENKQVDAAAITVETLEGTVMLSGFAKSAQERSTAESIARATKGVKAVKNQLDVRG
jgi:osmotically-inducible protein OsmY